MSGASAATASATPPVPPTALSPEDLAEFLECARYGELEDVQELLRAGADVNHADGNGATALHKAAGNGHVDVLRVLHAAGARYVANASGNTPLHWACMNGHEPAVRALLELYTGAGVDVLAKNSFGRSPLTEALGAGHEEVARLLLTHRSLEPSRSASDAGGSDAAAATSAADAPGGDADRFVEEAGSDVDEEDVADDEDAGEVVDGDAALDAEAVVSRTLASASLEAGEEGAATTAAQSGASESKTL